jgi:hypothetical protein
VLPIVRYHPSSNWDPPLAHIWRVPTVSFAGLSVHGRQSPFRCTLSGQSGGDNGNSSDGLFPALQIRTVGRSNKLSDPSSSCRSRARDHVVVMQKRNGHERDRTADKVTHNAVVRTCCVSSGHSLAAPTRTFAASSRYQVCAIAEHQHKGLLRLVQSNEEKTGCVGTDPCVNGRTVIPTRRLFPQPR